MSAVVHPARFGRRATATAVLVGAIAAAACAPRAPRAIRADPWPARLVDAARQSEEGCYRCLAAALRTYEEALAVRPDAATGTRAYRVAVHLALRERLIGLYPGDHQDAPARLRGRAGGDDADVADEVLGAIPWRRGTTGVGLGLTVAREDLPRLRARRQVLEARVDADPWQATLLLALVGTNPFLALEEGQRPPAGATPGLDRDAWWGRHPDDASLSFTRLSLLRSSLDDVARFRAAHPSFAETAVLVGEAELARGRLVAADDAFAEALGAFPSLTSALTLRGDIRQRMEDFTLAITSYDQVLLRVPEHREALMGRVKSLGFLGRHVEAIAGADRMLELGTWYVGEAYYWKAWNLFTLARLDEARQAVDAARRLLVNADLHHLGGVIAFRQQRLDDALPDFDAAIELEGRHCEAHFDRAALHLTRRNWPVAASGFDEAFACLGARTPVLEQRIVDAREARLPDEARAALVVRREQALRDHEHQRAWARYNAGVGYANAGKPDVGRERAEEAVAIGGPASDAARRLLPQLPAK